MKTINKIIVLLAVLSNFSCEKHLYKDPIGLITPNQIEQEPTERSIELSVSSCYQLLSSTIGIIGEGGDDAWNKGIYTRVDFVLSDIASDDVRKMWSNNAGDQYSMTEIEKFIFTSENANLNGLWSYDYEGIARTNLALSFLTNEEVINKVGMDADKANRLLGETLFLRAFFYFDLVINFGDVPLLLKKIENFEEAYELSVRVEKEKVWEQIREDLTAAKGLLPDGKVIDTEFRASKGAVIAMQAKVALYNKNWQDVLEKVEELEALGYALNDSYRDSFDASKETEESEVIFAYDHRTGQNPRRGNGLGALTGWRFIAPTDDFIDVFELTDPRLLYTLVDDVTEVTSLDANTIKNVINQREYPYKYLGGESKGNDDAGNNRIFIRYADVLLWKAEALIETEENSAAIDIINTIRERARNSYTIDEDLIGYPNVPAGTLDDRGTPDDKSQAMEWLRYERRVELGMENHRYYDLRRWRIAEDVLKDNGFDKSKHYLYAIPQSDIDKSGGMITQNEGY